MLLCIYRSGFMPAQARASRAVTFFCGFVVLVPLFPFQKLTDLPALF